MAIAPSPTIITIGNFDGVHRGHRRILQRAGELAAVHGAEVVAMAFDPHPATLLRPEAAPPRLMPRGLKEQTLLQSGAHRVVFLEPAPQLMGQSPGQFVADLVTRYHPAAMVEGQDFRFGKRRQGDVHTLAELGRQHGFSVEVIEPVEVALSDQLQAPVSSSLIRWLLTNGRVADAAICLTSPYRLIGQVIPGQRRGRELGIPTANVDAASLDQLVPADGVYAGFVQVQDQPQRHPAAISIGNKPTFQGSPRVIEAHLLDFTGDLYGQTLTISLSRWLRDQQPFPSLDDLKAQLQRDVQQTREVWDQLIGQQ